MSLPFGSPAEEKMPPAASLLLDTVLSEFCQLVTVIPTFLRHQLLRSAALQWNGRTLRGRQRIVRYLRQKQRVGAFHDVAFENPIACAPFDLRVSRPVRSITANRRNQPDGDGAQPKSQEDMLELRAALAAGMRRSARGKRRTSALTAASEDGDEGQAQSEPEEEDQDLFSSAPAKKPDSGESFEDGFTTPPRASDVAVPLSTASYQVLHTVAKEGKSPSSTDSSRTNSEDDDELTSQQVHEAAIEKLRPMDTTNPESGWVYTATGAGAATSATFGELQYLRATTSTNFSTAGASSPTHGYLYRNPVVADSTSPDPPTLGLSYRIHRASLRPHFDQIVFRWSKPHVTRSAVRRKLFKTEPKGDQDDAAGEPETPTARVSGLPAPPQRANDSLMFQSLRRSPPPSPRPVHYPNPPGTPIKRRRDITMPQRTPSAVVDSTTSPTSSSSLSSSSSSFSTTSTSSYASASHDYGRVRRKQLRSAELPSMPPTRAAATNADVSAASSNIPFLFGHTGASESGAMLIRLGNIPQPTIVRGEATRKAPAAAAATTPAAPVRKPLRF